MKWLMEIIRSIGRKLVLKFVFGVPKRDVKRSRRQHWEMDK